MLGEDYPLLQTYEKIQQAYTNDDNILVLIEARQGSVFNQEILSGVKSLTKALWQTPFSVRVDSLTNFQHTTADGDDLLVQDLVSRPLELTNSQLTDIRKVALSEPQLLNRAVNEQGNVTAINISFAFPNKSLNEKLTADEFVQAEIEQFRRDNPQINAYVAGIIALDATVMRISQKESGMFLMLLLSLAVVLMIIILKSLRPVLASVFVVLFSIAAGMAFSGFMGWKLTPFTASVPMMILVLAVADSIHLISGYLQARGKGYKNKEAVRIGLQNNAKPIAVTSVTTAIGFLTLNFSDSESIGALGSQVAFGVMVAFVLSVTLLPALLVLIKDPKTPGKKMQGNARFSLNVKALSFWVVARHRDIIVAGMALFLGMGAFIHNNEFNDNLPTYFSKSLQWRQANDFAEQEFGGAYTFSYSLQSGREGGVSSVQYLEDIESFSSWLRTLPQVAHVATLSDTMKRLNRSMHGDDAAFYHLPENQELAAQYLLLYEMSLPFGLDLNNQVNLDKSATKIVVTFRTMSTKQVLETESLVNRWLSTHLPDMKVEGTGVQMMFAHLLNDDTKGLIFGAVIGVRGDFPIADLRFFIF